jgi:hypothetical protein
MLGVSGSPDGALLSVLFASVVHCLLLGLSLSFPLHHHHHLHPTHLICCAPDPVLAVVPPCVTAEALYSHVNMVNSITLPVAVTGGGRTRPLAFTMAVCYNHNNSKVGPPGSAPVNASSSTLSVTCTYTASAGVMCGCASCRVHVSCACVRCVCRSLRGLSTRRRSHVAVSTCTSATTSLRTPRWSPSSSLPSPRTAPW